MKELYLKVLTLLSGVEELNWIDLDKGQLDIGNARPAVDFPCALIKVEVTQAKDMNATGLQRCVARVTVRLAFDYHAPETNSLALEDARLASLNYFDVADKVFKALQGKPAGKGNLTRLACLEERRSDGLKVVSIPFQTQFIQQG